MMHEVMVERRHQVEIGDALAGNERQRALRVEPRRQTNVPPTSDMASSERTPIVWYSGMTPSVRSSRE
jgi:hypothetical protein